MRKPWEFHWLGVVLAGLVLAGLAWGETLEMVTYYPAPAATAQDLHVRSLTVGTAYNNEAPEDGETLIFDRLGIGTNDPQGPLHVVGVDDALSSVVFMPGADTAAAGTPSIRVGIGTNNPQQKLVVISEGGPGGGDGIDITGLAPRLMVMGGPAGFASGLGSATIADNYGAGTLPGDMTLFTQGGNLRFGAGQAGGNPTIRMSITPAGNVGIGTLTPLGMLEINNADNSYTPQSLRIVTPQVGAEAPVTFGLDAHDGSGRLVSTGGIAVFLDGDNNTNNDPKVRFEVLADSEHYAAPAKSLFGVWENGNAGLGTQNPTGAASPGNGRTTGNLDANDIWLRAANAGAGQWVSAIAAAAGGGGSQFDASGSYAGNGAADRLIPLTFQPKHVLIYAWGSGGDGVVVFEKWAGMPLMGKTNEYSFLSPNRVGNGGGGDPPLVFTQTFLEIRAGENGFRVGGNSWSGYTNGAGQTYYWMAWD